MSVETPKRNVLFPNVTDPVIRSSAAGTWGINVGTGAGMASIYALEGNHPAYAGLFLSLGGAAFFLTRMNFNQVNRLTGRVRPSRRRHG